MPIFPEPSWITAELLRDLTLLAQASPRRRKNHNFHAKEDAACQRLLNAVEPDSYIAPHRHLNPAKDETILLLCGRIGLVLFDESGGVTGDAVLDVAASRFGVTVPPGTFHTLISLAPGSVFFEAKAGPYLPLTEQERAPWAPHEGARAAVAYLATLRKRFA
ncbi:MAG: WbuC family cupin fold metalloprotein [Burkholderiales bacterium]|nr:WbuC family cupin fold metalloprotein [Burkholderiales bacterium]